MWFLTHDGIDPLDNGKEFKPYKLMDGDEEVNSMMNLNWLYVDSKGTIWEIGKEDARSAMIQNTTVLSWYTTYPKRSERTSNPDQLRFCGCQQRNMALQ